MSIEDRNLKPGTVLVARYKKQDHRCEVVAGEEGKVVYRLKGGKEFSSPSAAGSAVMGGVACNGWRFWSLEGAEEPTRKATTRATAPKKAPAKPKAAAKPKSSKRAKTAAKPKTSRRAKGRNPSPNGAEPELPAEKPIACGDCGEEFPNAREAAEHLRDEHGSQEAAGSGGR